MDVSPGSCGSEVVIQRNAPHMAKGLKSKKTMSPVLNVGADDVMMQKGKLENVKLEMKRAVRSDMERYWRFQK